MTKNNINSYGFVTATESNNERLESRGEQDKRDIFMAINHENGDLTRIGISVLDLQTHELCLLNFNDTPSYMRAINQINVFKPTTIIILEPAMCSQSEKLKFVVESNTETNVRKLLKSPKYFDFLEGINLLQTYVAEECNELKESVFQGLLLTRSKLSIGAANAVINFSIMNQEVEPKFKLRISVTECDNLMLIDPKTIIDLELVDSLNGKGITLYSFLNRCCTKMGERLLRSSILQPLTDIPSIKFRLEAVAELLPSNNNNSVLGPIKKLLKQCKDIDKIVVSFLNNNDSKKFSDQNINTILLLKTALIASIEIGNTLDISEAILMKQMREIFKHENLLAAVMLIEKYINSETGPARRRLDLAHQKANAVKNGINGLLDVSRSVRETILGQVEEYVENLATKNLLAMDYRFENTRGFYLRIKLSNGAVPFCLPDEFVNRIVKKNVMECTTISLLQQGARMNDIVGEINNLSTIIIEELFERCREYVPIFLMMSEAIAILDMLCSFADFINMQKRSYVCPEFGNYTHICQSRHPILETLVPDFVPNEYSSIPEISRFQIITGANMSGKSVYLRQFAYLVIMAQMGIYVPAEYATMSVYNSLYSRLSTDTSEINASSFTNEMSEMNRIISNININSNTNTNSLILIDELGRGTSLKDGYSICLAILEYLALTKATVITSTHFQEVAEILSNKSCVVVSHMQSTEVNGKLKSLYKLQHGKLSQTGYGIKYAESTQILPLDMLQVSKLIAERLRTCSKSLYNTTAKLVSKRRKLIWELYFALKQIHELDCKNQYKIDLLRTLQARFVDEISDVQPLA